MKKLTYILLFIWNVGIGQTGSIYTTDTKPVTISINLLPDTMLSGVRFFSGFESKPLMKYDTVKAVLLTVDTSMNFRADTPGFYYKGIVDWEFGFVIIQSEYGVVECEMKQCLHAAYHYGYGNKKTIGYLDLTKQPFPKEFIIWDYKTIE